MFLAALCVITNNWNQPINRWMGKEIVLFPRTETLFGNKKKWAIHTYNSVNNRKTRLSERSRTKKEYVLYDSIYTKLSKMEKNLWWQRADQGLPGEGLGRRRQRAGREQRLGEASWMCSLPWMHMSELIKLYPLNSNVSFCMPIMHHQSYS